MKQSVEETLRRSQEVTRQYEEFKKSHAIYLVDVKKTQEKLENTLSLVSETLEQVQNTKDKFEAVQKAWDNAIDRLADRAAQEMGATTIDAVAEMSTPQQAGQLLAESKRVFILTGAGISAASGIRTFRGTGGYWTSDKDEDDPKKILTLNYFQAEPVKCWKWLVDFYNLKTQAKPNVAHYSLNRIMDYLLSSGKDVTLVTQNIDNLHHEARQECQLNKELERMSLVASKTKQTTTGKLSYYEIHGNITKLRCQKCTLQKGSLVFDPANFGKCSLPYEPPKCSKCGEPVRPHIMFFDESYCEAIHHYDSVLNELNESDLVIVIGTMLQTGLANGVVSKAVNAGKNIIEVNTNQQILRGYTKCLLGKAEQLLPEVVQYYEKVTGRRPPSPLAKKNNAALKSNSPQAKPKKPTSPQRNKKK